MPIHSYPLIYKLSFYFKCVSDIATMSGWCSYTNCCILCHFARMPFTFIWTIFILSVFRFVTCVLVILIYSSRLVYLSSFLSSPTSLLSLYTSSYLGSSPSLHFLMASICSLLSGAPNWLIACCHIAGKYKFSLVMDHAYLMSSHVSLASCY